MLRLVNVVEHPKPVPGSESKFPCRLKESGPFQGFSMACLHIRLIGQPFRNGPANERIVFGLNRPQMTTGDWGIDSRERLLRFHRD